jgi:hypothetical protein
MTSGIVVINGKPITVATVTARAFTTNVDTYIDVLDAGDETGTVVYTTATTNAASPALASNSIRIGIIQAAATITAATKVNQGQEDKVFPIASSIPYAVTDSLGNLICPRDPQRRILGYRQIIANQTGVGATDTQVTGLSVPVIIPTGRKVKLTAFAYAVDSSTSGAVMYLGIWDGVVVSGTLVAKGSVKGSAVSSNGGLITVGQTTPGATSKTYNASLSGTAGSIGIYSAATTPTFLQVELA